MYITYKIRVNQLCSQQGFRSVSLLGVKFWGGQKLHVEIWLRVGAPLTHPTPCCSRSSVLTFLLPVTTWNDKTAAREMSEENDVTRDLASPFWRLLTLRQRPITCFRWRLSRKRRPPEARNCRLREATVPRCLWRSYLTSARVLLTSLCPFMVELKKRYVLDISPRPIACTAKYLFWRFSFPFDKHNGVFLWTEVHNLRKKDFIFLFILSKLYSPWGAWTHNLGIKSYMFY